MHPVHVLQFPRPAPSFIFTALLTLLWLLLYVTSNMHVTCVSDLVLQAYWQVDRLGFEE